MDKILRVLILGAYITDDDLIDELREARIPFISARVIKEKDFVQALQDFSPDLILSDYGIPQYNGAPAWRKQRLDVLKLPSSDRSIKMQLTSGAKDYVMKHRLNRLVYAVP
jgi:DNA-binding response OmpR family regulator